MASTIHYRTSGPWGAGLGYDLNAAEVDQSFHALERDIARAAARPATQSSAIRDIQLSQESLRIFRASGAVADIALPRLSYRWRGTLNLLTVYQVGDVVLVPGEGIYALLPGNPASFKLVYGQLSDEADNRPSIIVSGSRQLELEDVGWYLRATAPATLVLRTQAAVAWPTGANFVIRQAGGGAVQIGAEQGVTVNVPEDRVPVSEGRGAVMHMRRASSNVWDVWGNLRRTV